MTLRTAASALTILALGCAPGAAPPPVTVVAITLPPPVIVAPPTSPDPPRAIRVDGGGWPLFHGDAARTGHVGAPAIHAPRVLWSARVGIQGWLNAPVIAGSLVVVPSSGDTHNAADPRDGLHAIDLASGRERWHARLAADADGVAISGDRAIVGSDDGRVTAIELASGRALWSSRMQGKAYASPLPLGDQVIVGDASGTVRALRLDDGSPRWQVQLDGAIRGGAAAAEGVIYAVSQGGEVIALRVDGTPIWRVRLDKVAASAGAGEVYAAPLVAGARLIIAFTRDTYYGSPALLALDRASGKLAWSAKARGASQWGNVRMTPALIDGALIWPEAYSGDVASLDAATGKERFRTTVGPCFFPSWAAPAAADGVVYVPRFDGSLYAVRPGDGEVLWRFYLGEEKRVGRRAPLKDGAPTTCAWEVASGTPLYAPPAITEDGTILVGSGEGFLYAIGEER